MVTGHEHSHRLHRRRLCPQPQGAQSKAASFRVVIGHTPYRFGFRYAGGTFETRSLAASVSYPRFLRRGFSGGVSLGEPQGVLAASHCSLPFSARSEQQQGAKRHPLRNATDHRRDRPSPPQRSSEGTDPKAVGSHGFRMEPEVGPAVFRPRKGQPELWGPPES